MSNPAMETKTISKTPKRPRFRTALNMSDSRLQKQKHEASREEDEAELEELDEQIREMADRILHFRRTVPDLLKETLVSSFVSKRPDIPQIDTSLALPSADCKRGGEHAESSNHLLLEGEDLDTTAKVCLLKSKISSNISAMPALLKRMQDCITAIDKLDRCSTDIHPVFKRKWTKQ